MAGMRNGTPLVAIESQMRTRPHAPRNRLRLLATNEQDTISPVLVCETCKAWTRHAPALGHEASGTQWVCSVDSTRRTWGAR